MTSKQILQHTKINLIQQILNYYFCSPPIPLNSINEFTFLIAVILSAQTTDGIVNQVTQQLFPIASTPELLSKVHISDVQRIIQPVGLANRKAEYLVNLSKKLIEVFDGRVPSTFKELESLPGVGHKTASVVMSQVFGKPSIAVDTHVHRLSLRWGLTKEQKNPDKVQEDLCQLFPESDWNKLHLQMIYFGREFCTAKNHQDHQCPICSWIHKNDFDSFNVSTENLSRFESKTRTKGIVYYSDRLSELQQLKTPEVEQTDIKLSSSPSGRSVSMFTQSMSNLMNGYLNTSCYTSPVPCEAEELKVVRNVKVQDDQTLTSPVERMKNEVPVDFLLEFGFKEPDESVKSFSVGSNRKRFISEKSSTIKKMKSVTKIVK